jgi:hypothetical protein
MTFIISILVKRGYFLVHHGCSSELLDPTPHDSLHSSPFYLKGPWTAATGKPPETRGCIGKIGPRGRIGGGKRGMENS